MTTEVSKTKDQVPATMSNLYTEYGLTVASGNIDFLKFKKGIYEYGSANTVLPVNTRVVANMPELTVGPLKWLDGKPVANEMKRLCDGPIKTRKELDCPNKEDWPINHAGDRTDPWQFTNVLPMRDPETGKEFKFTTSSRGGLDAIGALSFAYGEHMAKHNDGSLPVIELGAGEYDHPAYGLTQIPVFRVVEWKSEAELMGGGTDAGVGDTAKALDDDIPF